MHSTEKIPSPFPKKFINDDELIAEMFNDLVTFSEAFSIDSNNHYKRWSSKILTQLKLARSAERDFGRDHWLTIDDYATIGKIFSDYAIAYVERVLVDEDHGWENQDVSHWGMAETPMHPYKHKSGDTDNG